MGLKSNIYRNTTSPLGGRSNQPFFLKQVNATSKDPKETFFSPGVRVGRPNDQYEKEADLMANQVVNKLDRSSASVIQRKCAECEKEEKQVQPKREDDKNVQLKDIKEEEEEGLQKKSNEEDEERDLQLKSNEVEEDDLLQKKDDPEEEEEEVMLKPAVNQRSDQSISPGVTMNQSNGTPLPIDARRQMEQSFGADFRHVNIHTDDTSIQMNEELHAQAFTHGSDIYFNKGKYDPATSAGKHLLAHELTHVVQQNSDLKKKCIQRQLVFGSGYAGFPSVTDEIDKARRSKWNPTTVDFSTNVGRSGGGDGAKDLPELLKVIEKQSKASITQLGIIGHSNSRALGLSGDVHSQGVPLSGLITESTLKSNQAKINATKDRFADGAAITLFSCNSGGISNGLADVISEAFGVCVKGFKNDVLWCITFNESPKKITSRGNVFYENPNDPLAGIGAHPSCANFHKKVHDLTPDVSSCKGVKKAQDKKCVAPTDLPVFQNPSGFQLISFNDEREVANDLPQPGSVLEGLTIMDGMNHEDVEKRFRVTRMQQRLNHHGAALAEDGIFGKNTLSFLNQFQSRIGLTRSPVVDQQTAGALMLPSLIPGDVSMLSQIEGLKKGDGLTFGTMHLRPRVSRLQQLLTIHGNFTKVDGMFGPKTASALNIFQALNDLSTSDVVDGDSADALEGRTSKFCPFGQIPVLTA